MSWAARRRTIILFGIGAVVVAFLAIITILVFYQAPTCTDGIENQDEAGVDCGGPCRYLCTSEVQPPVVLFSSPLDNGSGRIDTIALVENKNATAAAKQVPYRITLFDKNGSFLKEVDSIIDLPPGATVPVYIPGVASAGGSAPASAFLDIAPAAPRWYRLANDPRIVPTVQSVTRSDANGLSRIMSVLSNQSVVMLSNVHVTVFVYDAEGNVIAASETIVPSVGAQGKATAVFTWDKPFSAVPASIRVMPVIPLP